MIGKLMGWVVSFVLGAIIMAFVISYVENKHYLPAGLSAREIYLMGRNCELRMPTSVMLHILSSDTIDIHRIRSIVWDDNLQKSIIIDWNNKYILLDNPVADIVASLEYDCIFIKEKKYE